MELPPGSAGRPTVIAGRTCLAGDIFGTYRFPDPLKVGDLVAFADAAGYTMVKKNWFNGLPMPSIAVRRLDGTVEVVKRFTYEDYLSSLS
jgi:carboxynorspermidine decarboxylase